MSEITGAITRLRRARNERLATTPQAEIVEAVCELARRWRDPAYLWRRRAEVLINPFPFAMTRVSLDALLMSLSRETLEELIDQEDVHEKLGYTVVAHIIAGNTPLLAWTSVIRALLMRSASFVKLPSGPAARWGYLFRDSLVDLFPNLAECVYWAQWPGGSTTYEAELCDQADCVLAYGSDQTVASLRHLCPARVRFIGFGHRVSFGLVPRETHFKSAVAGYAEDILLYDQGGCLSPQTIFVEGEWDTVIDFGEQLAAALAETVPRFPLPARAPQAAMQVLEARTLARMGQGNKIWEGSMLRWTVVARQETTFIPSPTYGVVTVQPIASLMDLPKALAPVKNYLQGCAVAPSSATSRLPYELAISYLCVSGQLQAPPFSWRQDGRDVLRSLLPSGGRYEESGL